ncbi:MULTISPECIES: GMC family oxidoreductase [unclassified Streptomyces]|uniref:GMC family oxidoreductase n=1 Tax=unclassified Streptomyces TaxID=2593676 RepID=UPI000F5BE5B8|nr:MULTISPECIES: GMC family oxidoreductase [unclassified Streptomyces]WSG52829.1 GMC family oxidoreductase [Streptomyces sp. NBC_01732]WSX03471.1 GMC family oxidoreductase [Streptomyces sp. NBC_00987]MCX5102802.1 GMC family oxidoreductase [Streptomyces sp. NBC_00439]RPK75852.1 Cholesterol oxidase [Streptomyces sp. ADI95-17]WSC28232.1 GMC family oxidoreductase [Streptomyces sp. NBC_01768]
MSQDSPAQNRPVAPEKTDDDAYDYDVLVVGSGFGGAVSALRLTEKGYRVGVLEAGRRFTRSELPRNSWDLKNFLWAPTLGLYGIQRIHLLGNVMVLAGAGVGGGSLNYANTLYEPLAPFFDDPQWKDITDWREELGPYYDQAKRMLGVRLNPTMTPSDVHLKATAQAMGIGDTFHMAPVGVFFGDGEDGDGTAKARPGGEVPDPFFGGAGPSRKACTECGECMTGCRHGAKNTLNENYLHLAQKAGAVVHPMTSVVAVTENSRGGYAVKTLPTDNRKKGKGRTFTAREVVVAAGTYGTQTLLHRMKDTGLLPRISSRLGELTRTNSEGLVGSQTSDRRYRKKHGTARADFTRGVAITSSIHPDENTHIEPVRYGKGSNSMGALTVLQVPYGAHRVRRWLLELVKHPTLAARSLSNRRWSERTIIGLVMQSLDNSLTTYRKPGGVGKGLLTARQGHGAPNPTQIEAATRSATLLAEEINGFAGSNVGELMGTPLTAHFLGGCPIGATADDGVIDPYHRLYGHPGISVVDGSAVSANLGVNPSLTITAQAERAMSLWPNKGEADPRPAQGEAYERLAAVEPRSPAVPKEAFGALKLPFLGLPSVPPKKPQES